MPSSRRRRRPVRVNRSYPLAATANRTVPRSVVGRPWRVRRPTPRWPARKEARKVCARKAGSTQHSAGGASAPGRPAGLRLRGNGPQASARGGAEPMPALGRLPACLFFFPACFPPAYCSLAAGHAPRRKPDPHRTSSTDANLPQCLSPLRRRHVTTAWWLCAACLSDDGWSRATLLLLMQHYYAQMRIEYLRNNNYKGVSSVGLPKSVVIVTKMSIYKDVCNLLRTVQSKAKHWTW